MQPSENKRTPSCPGTLQTASSNFKNAATVKAWQLNKKIHKRLGRSVTRVRQKMDHSNSWKTEIRRSDHGGSHSIGRDKRNDDAASLRLDGTRPLFVLVSKVSTEESERQRHNDND